MAGSEEKTAPSVFYERTRHIAEGDIYEIYPWCVHANNMEVVLNEILRALIYLLATGAICFAWKAARDNAKTDAQGMVLWKGFLWCVGIALFAGITIGSPACEESSDPVYGGCERYADNGYQPTNEQRVARFAFFITLLYVPVVFGTLSGNKEKANRKNFKS